MTIEQANEYFSSLPEGFAPAEELRAALTADVQKVQFVGVAGTAGKTAAAGLLAAILRVKRHVCFIMSGLCTPFTVFAAIPAFGIDDGTSVELVSHEVAGDLMSCFVEGFLIRNGSQFFCLFFVDHATGKNVLFECFNHVFGYLYKRKSRKAFSL